MENENKTKSATQRVLCTRCGCQYGEASADTLVVLVSCNPTKKPVGEIIPVGMTEMVSIIREMIKAGKLPEGFLWVEDLDSPKAPGRVVRFECGCRVEELKDGRGRILYSCPKMVKRGWRAGTETSNQLGVLIAMMELLGGTAEWEEEGLGEDCGQREDFL